MYTVTIQPKLKRKLKWDRLTDPKYGFPQYYKWGSSQNIKLSK